MSLYGYMSNTPELNWSLEGQINVGLNGFCLSGMVSSSSVTREFVALLDGQFGPFGSVHFYTRLGYERPFLQYPAGPGNEAQLILVMQGEILVDVAVVNEFLGKIRDWLIVTLSGEDNPSDTNLVRLPLNTHTSCLPPDCMPPVAAPLHDSNALHVSLRPGQESSRLHI